MTLRHMLIFVRVCESNTITKAAETLHLSQPAVSLAIRELEDYYGVVFFDRIARKLQITERGQLFLEYAIHITSLFDEVQQRLRNLDHVSTIRIGSSVTIGTRLMSSLVEQFMIESPETKIQVVIDKSDMIERKVIANEIDFALIEGFTHFDQLHCESFLEDQLVVVCSTIHSLASKKIISKEEFSACQFLLREHGSGTRELIDSTLLANGIHLLPIWESISTEAIVNAIQKNIGISILPLPLVQQYLLDNTLCELCVDGIEFKRYFRIIYHKKKYLSSAVQTFIDLTKKQSKLLLSTSERNLTRND